MMIGVFSMSGRLGLHRRDDCNSFGACRADRTQDRVQRLPSLQSPSRSAGIAMLALVSGSVAWAQAADPSDIAEGGRLFRQKASCQSCHGWAGDGRKMDTQMPDGANLRETM